MNSSSKGFSWQWYKPVRGRGTSRWWPSLWAQRFLLIDKWCGQSALTRAIFSTFLSENKQKSPLRIYTSKFWSPTQWRTFVQTFGRTSEVTSAAVTEKKKKTHMKTSKKTTAKWRMSEEELRAAWRVERKSWILVLSLSLTSDCIHKYLSLWISL